MEKGVGDIFQKETKYAPDKQRGSGIDWDKKPPLYKEYPDVKTVPLIPSGEISSDLKTSTFDHLLWERKSVRAYAAKPLDFERLSYILWAAAGKQRIERDHQFRTVPSAGALYPIETYAVINAVTGILPGVYHYSVKDHALEIIKEGEYGGETAEAALGQKMCAEAPLVLVWTAIFERTKWKYEQRAYRYIYLDAGHVGHSLALTAVALGLGSCQIAALYDDEVNAVIGVDGENESVIYMSVVGYPAR